MICQPKTGERCNCKRGVWRDNCPKCEGTGWVIDFRAIHERAIHCACGKPKARAAVACNTCLGRPRNEPGEVD